MDISSIAKEYKLYVDTSVLMHSAPDQFFNIIKKSLLQSKNKLFFHKSVKEYELKNIAKGDVQKKDLEKYGFEKAKIIAKNKQKYAKKGLEILEDFKKEECGQGFQTGKDIGAADNNYVVVFTKLRLKYKLCLLSNDIGLSKEIYKLNKSESSEFDKAGNRLIKGIKVVRIDKKGHPYEFTLPKRFIESEKCDVSNKSKKLNQSIPKIKDTVVDEVGCNYELMKDISNGGGLEGIIYSTNYPSYVCKIFKDGKLTDLKLKKIKLMISNKPYVTGVCWPISIVFNLDNEPVGYVMLFAGRPLDEAIDLSHIIGKKIIKKFFPDFKTLDLVKISLKILEKINELHQYNVVLGDIKPGNILITSKNLFIYFVDTDNYQIENFPCTGGEDEFTPPERQGVKYDTYLRTIEEESFAVATLLFKIFMLRISPFRNKLGGTTAKNIKEYDFPYRLNGMSSGKEIEVGLKRWRKLPDYLQEAFYNFFTNKEMMDVPGWIETLNRYSSEWMKQNRFLPEREKQKGVRL